MISVAVVGRQTGIFGHEDHVARESGYAVGSSSHTLPGTAVATPKLLPPNRKPPRQSC